MTRIGADTAALHVVPQRAAGGLVDDDLLRLAVRPEGGALAAPIVQIIHEPPLGRLLGGVLEGPGGPPGEIVLEDGQQGGVLHLDRLGRAGRHQERLALPPKPHVVVLPRLVPGGVKRLDLPLRLGVQEEDQARDVDAFGFQVLRHRQKLLQFGIINAAVGVVQEQKVYARVGEQDQMLADDPGVRREVIAEQRLGPVPGRKVRPALRMRLEILETRMRLQELGDVVIRPPAVRPVPLPVEQPDIAVRLRPADLLVRWQLAP